MPSNKKLAKELEKLSEQLLDQEKRKTLLDSLSGEKTEWFKWTAEMKGLLKNLDKAEAVKFSGLVLLLEQKPKSGFYQDNLKKFLVDKVEFYKYYDFSLERKLTQKEKTEKKLWISKIFRLFISRSFLGILILALIIGFIVWFYADRESCLEFVQGVVGPFLKAIK
jgi:ABC-type antimicrobial peptide transport system permease subunit